MSKKVVVTGGCGYIGSHVVRALKTNDPSTQVVIVDNVYREHTVKDADGVIIDDYASDAVLSSIYNFEPDAVVHCAGTSLVGPSVSNPAEYYGNNVAKTIKMLDAIKNMPHKPVIIFSSSASVYGEPDSVPISEQSRIQPKSPYGQTKAMIEQILADYAIPYNLPSICLRYFNAAGAVPDTYDLGQEPGATHIIARAIESSISKKEFFLYGHLYNTPDGTCVRDYVHVWDIAMAHVQAIKYAESTALWNQRKCYNLGTNKGISNLQIINYIQEVYGLERIVTFPPRDGDPAVLIADASQAYSDLNWHPQYSDLNTIIDSAYKWYCRK